MIIIYTTPSCVYCKMAKALFDELGVQYEEKNVAVDDAAREAMVKIIESSYIHAHAIPAGDLKHYAITLMAPGVPVIAILSNDDLRSDVLNAIHEVKTRGAFVTGVSPLAAKEFDQTLLVPDTKETSAIMNIIPLQLLAYYMSVHLGNNVDKPRNIAKSVTVK